MTKDDPHQLTLIVLTYLIFSELLTIRNKNPPYFKSRDKLNERSDGNNDSD